MRINGVLAPLAGDAAVDLVGHPGDMDFDGRYTGDDVTAVSRTAIGFNFCAQLFQALSSA